MYGQMHQDSIEVRSFGRRILSFDMLKTICAVYVCMYGQMHQDSIELRSFCSIIFSFDIFKTMCVIHHEYTYIQEHTMCAIFHN
jgi:hypothetical protein